MRWVKTLKLETVFAVGLFFPLVTAGSAAEQAPYYAGKTSPEPTPLTGEEFEKAIKELPRDLEVIALYKKLAESGPLPPR